MATTPPRRAVYTALIGEYEELNEQPIAGRSDVPFICLTDSPSLRSDTWQVHVVEPLMPSDPIRSARALKLLGHPLVDAVDETLWIDNSVVLRVPPEEILDEWLEGADFASPLHSYRSRLIDEFDAVVQAGFDDPARVYEQARHYVDEHPTVLQTEPLWTAILARRNTPVVSEMCQRWFMDVLRYSRRDQLSVLVAIDRSPELRWRAVELDNHASPLHEWPVMASRERFGPKRNAMEALKPIALQLREMERTVEERSADLRRTTEVLDASREQALALIAAVSHREHELSRLTAEIERLAGELTHRGEELAAAREATDVAARRIEDMEASRSWRAGRALSRLARPLRWLRNAVR